MSGKTIMERSLIKTAASALIILGISFTACKKTENPIKFPYGTFPDTVTNLDGINSAFDDYNCDVYQLYGEIYILFSSNRGSSGGQYDFEQGKVAFIWDQTTGEFRYTSSVSSLPFLDRLIEAAGTPGNDFGPYSLFSRIDGYEYLFTASETASGDLDFYYFRNFPAFGGNLPEIQGPYPASLINTAANDAYISFDIDHDTIYFSSDSGGNFDIYIKERPSETPVDEWMDGAYSASEKVESINSEYDDKCPVVYRDVMLFASNRPGGMGNYDIYYSLFRNGAWSSPVNMGPDVNTSSDEFRPRLWIHGDFENDLIIFSSNRPGGKGLFDLYFIGYSFPEE